MKFNQWTGQFLRREEAECFVDTIDFPPLLELAGFHTYLWMINDPDLQGAVFFSYFSKRVAAWEDLIWMGLPFIEPNGVRVSLRTNPRTHHIRSPRRRSGWCRRWCG